MLRHVFTDHPASVGESYGAHFRTASSVGAAMVVAGLACFAHALVPALFQTTGSRAIRRLSSRLGGARAAEAEARSGWVI